MNDRDDEQRRPPSGRTSHEVLSADLIVRAAIAIADADGLEAVSMRRIAADLGSGTMSLYRHVPTREALIERMVDEIAGRFTFAAPPPDWRDALRTAALRDWEMYREHPWVLAANATTRPPLGPHVLRAMEWSMNAIGAHGLTIGDRYQITMTVSGYVQGIATMEIEEPVSERQTGLSADAWWERRVPLLQQHLENGEFPFLSQLPSDTGDGLFSSTFRFGLERLLDGIELYLTQRAGRIV